ncbi:MAG: hypothetical protein SCH70_13625 [Candidatus Methanoperedens sp.]|nr:hypothetical protein [Candidatus Methanoperedens sp.]
MCLRSSYAENFRRFLKIMTRNRSLTPMNVFFDRMNRIYGMRLKLYPVNPVNPVRNILPS